MEQHARRAHGGFDRARRDREHGGSLLPDASAGRDRSTAISRSDSEKRGADPLAAAAGRTVVDAVRPGTTGGGVSDRARAVGTSGGGRARIESAGGQGDRLSASPSTIVRWVDGPAPVVREFPHAVSRNTNGGAGAQLVFPSRSAPEGMGGGSARAAFIRSGESASGARRHLGSGDGRHARADPTGRGIARRAHPASRSGSTGTVGRAGHGVV